MRVTLARQSGFRKPLLRPRRTTQRTVVIGTRPAPLSPQNGLLASAACTCSTTCSFAYVCSCRRCVVIRVRPAPSFDQHGLLASTACTFLRRLMFIMFGRFQKTCAPLRREAHFGSPGLSPGGSRPPSGGPAPKGTPKALQGRGLGRLGLSLGGPRASFGRPPGSQKHPKVAPGTGRI